MKKISAEIVADSISPQGHRLITYLLVHPRFILPELLTHRVFSRNSASSRAIPFKKMVKMVEEDPFVPIAFQRNHSGMQGTDYLTGQELEFAKDRWNDSKNYAIECAKDLFRTGTTKQLCNRVLEPFLWHTTLVTATEFEGFFELRCPLYEDPSGKIFRSKKDYIKNSDWKGCEEWSLSDWLGCNKSQAEIHIQALAEAMWDALNESTPKQLKEGDWHIPFGDKFDESKLDMKHWIGDNTVNRIKVATARCARLSYMTHDGEINYEKDIKLHDQLLRDRHLSPFEHCSRAMSDEEYINYYRVFWKADEYFEYGWCNNFRGWIQYRHLIENMG